MTDPRSAKAHLRASIKERMARLRPGDLAAESRTLCKEAAALLPDEPSVICAYVPLTDEADVRDLLAAALARGHRLFLPAFDGRKLVFRRVTDLASVRKGALGTGEPPEDGEDLDPGELAMAFIPGRAFDRNGGRLGRGNGGYDAWIRGHRASCPDTRMIGVALECQLVQEVPMETIDERMDALITARGLLRAK